MTEGRSPCSGLQEKSASSTLNARHVAYSTHNTQLGATNAQPNASEAFLPRHCDTSVLLVHRHERRLCRSQPSQRSGCGRGGVRNRWPRQRWPTGHEALRLCKQLLCNLRLERQHRRRNQRPNSKSESHCPAVAKSPVRDLSSRTACLIAQRNSTCRRKDSLIGVRLRAESSPTRRLSPVALE